MDLTWVKEGRTTIAVPCQNPDVPFPPGTAPVFYNSRMALNRDTTVLIVRQTNPHSYLDAMAASGIRGCRVGYESEVPVTLNDRDPLAIDLITHNVQSLGIDAHVMCRDANSLMSEEKFGFVDLDPFGTPAPFVDAAIRSTGKYLGVTATDTAPLCGAHLKAGIRRYMARPLNTEYHTEVGLRILLGNVARHAAVYDKGVTPLFCYAHEHFVRLHLQLKSSATAADKSIARLGYVHQCPKCPYRMEEQRFFPGIYTCPLCGASLTPTGPLWTGSIHDPDILAGMIRDSETFTAGDPAGLSKLLAVCRDEPDISFSYDYHKLGKYYRLSPGPIDVLLNRLRDKGYCAGRVHYSGYGIKTDAPLEIIRDCLIQ
ncbi:tRNA (guanine(10)-N(2))-dimethyltransferase [Methanospirillum sp. J.3.6.1-F.2.7.3]|uniref:tRNA (guanine(26)-N(2))-dimethyltransferase n=1 Tax=Methanospirillum purgamenti TaxID=2834276 RepID=A0A8E7EGE1_9EURY|nr:MULTISPECIES: tRNA (guanine(10)-N(2))-dimethyltransferase [Methanospirillum]MDX8551087.1 tRNA (guanine(10)-N(2))-dimethyltransferase [Methanospirillum hungatei]QVV87747.1 tRNA (guanine(10)-N(2))-dimethyltransferase [Methanospirillum sp. J.3.6.1-F.2.7.3]